MKPEPEDITHDFFFRRKVIVFQRKKGYRFSIDAPLLAHFLPTCPKSEALEIGTGCGIIAMLALYKKKFSHIYGLEIQDQLSTLSEINARNNHFSRSFTAIRGDFNHVYNDFKGLSWIFSNPPFLRLNQGRVSLNQEIRISKSEEKLNLKIMLEKTFFILGQRGTLCLIYPYSRFKELTELSADIGFKIKKIQIVFSFNHGKPERFLIQLSKNKASMKEVRPLVIFKKKGVYTKEMEMILSG
ncbi:MAG: methyltransferase [Candidatus Aminicenantes bacterium]|nr:methyltransferase [Candidatus Aminicenantes bacterium]